MSSDALLVGGGVTSPAEARLASSGLLALQGPTPLDVRTGVLAGPGSTALLTGTTDTAPMTVQIGVHVAVTSRGNANGPYIGPTLEAPLKVNIGAAPGTGSRIDVVYSKQQDGNSGVPSPDVTTAPLYGVLAGVASGTPAKPDLSTIVGATELGTVQVAAGATSTNGAGVTITSTARQTTTRGGTIPVPAQADRLALTTFPSLRALELDKHRALYYDGAQWRYEGDFVPVANQTDRLALNPIYDGLRAKEADTGCVWTYDAATSKWLPFDTKWQSYTPAVYIGNGSTAWILGNGTSTGRYFRKGREITVEEELYLGSTSNFNAAVGNIAVDFPPGYAPAHWQQQANISPPVGGAWISNGAPGFGMVVINDNPSTPATRRFSFYTFSGVVMTSATGTAGSWNWWASGQSLRFQATYETAFEA